MDHYKLDDDNNAVPCSLREWGEMYESQAGNDRRRIAEDAVDGYWISTVFLGLDHNFYSSNPHLFETMIFGDKDSDGDGYTTRCTTWNQAIDMHQRAIQWVKDGCKDD